MLIGAGKLNRYLNTWLKDHGFECTCEFDLDFNYDSLNELIHYTLIVPLDHDEMFIQVCKDCREELVDVDCFILSFFHELGHYATEGMWSAKDWEDYDKYIDSLPTNMSDNDFNYYYHYPIEIEATQWGCDYIVENQEEIKKFWAEFQPLIMEFYSLNKVELDGREVYKQN
jgi:hypothetical protein